MSAVGMLFAARESCAFYATNYNSGVAVSRIR